MPLMCSSRARILTEQARWFAAVFLLTPLLALQAQDREFNPRTVISRSFPAIVEPKTVSAAKGDEEKWVSDEELVLGVVVNGTARAYPINTLTGPQREIINDKLGGRSIAATW
jgi:hypothetical protein